MRRRAVIIEIPLQEEHVELSTLPIPLGVLARADRVVIVEGDIAEVPERILTIKDRCGNA